MTTSINGMGSVSGNYGYGNGYSNDYGESRSITEDLSRVGGLLADTIEKRKELSKENNSFAAKNPAQLDAAIKFLDAKFKRLATMMNKGREFLQTRTDFLLGRANDLMTSITKNTNTMA